MIYFCLLCLFLTKDFLSLFPKVEISYLVVLEVISLLWFIKDLYHYHYSAQFHITAVKLNGFPLFFKVGQGAKFSSLLFHFFRSGKGNVFNVLTPRDP